MNSSFSSKSSYCKKASAARNNKFCPPKSQRRPLSFLLSLSYFYARIEPGKKYIYYVCTLYSRYHALPKKNFLGQCRKKISRKTKRYYWALTLFLFWGFTIVLWWWSSLRACTGWASGPAASWFSWWCSPCYSCYLGSLSLPSTLPTRYPVCGIILLVTWSALL